MSKPCEKCGGITFRTIVKWKKYKCRKCGTIREDVHEPIKYVSPIQTLEAVQLTDPEALRAAEEMIKIDPSAQDKSALIEVNNGFVNSVPVPLSEPQKLNVSMSSEVIKDPSASRVPKSSDAAVHRAYSEIANTPEGKIAIEMKDKDGKFIGFESDPCAQNQAIK